MAELLLTVAFPLTFALALKTTRWLKPRGLALMFAPSPSLLGDTCGDRFGTAPFTFAPPVDPALES
jgi:hypothetical protein